MVPWAFWNKKSSIEKSFNALEQTHNWNAFIADNIFLLCISDWISLLIHYHKTLTTRLLHPKIKLILPLVQESLSTSNQCQHPISQIFLLHKLWWIIYLNFLWKQGVDYKNKCNSTSMIIFFPNSIGYSWNEISHISTLHQAEVPKYYKLQKKHS